MFAILDKDGNEIQIKSTVINGEHIRHVIADIEDSLAINCMSQYLDSVGDGTGTKNLIGDYSGAATIFKIQPPAGEIYHLNRLMVYIEDVGTFDSGSYGNGISLTNGVKFRISDNSGVLHDMTPINIKKNVHWDRTFFDVKINNYGTGNEALIGRWTFANDYGAPVILNGDNNERLEVVLEDDFTGLVEHYFLTKGTKHDI